jgi:hypothetical protein
VRDDGFERFGNPAALRSVPAELLRLLLEPWRTQVGRGGADVHQGLRRLLGQERDLLPSTLVDALDRIDDLADEEGFDALLARVEGTGTSTDWPALGLSPLHVAVRAFVEHRPLFEQAEGRRAAMRATGMREYPAATDAPIQVPSPAARLTLQHQLGAWWRARGRGSWCRVGLFRQEGRFYFPIRHGRPLKTAAAVSEIEETAVVYRPRTDDLVIYDERTSRLMIKARDLRSFREYRRRFGALLLGAPDGFEECQVVTLAPLVERRRQALTPTPGLVDVALAELKLTIGEGEGAATIVVQAGDVFGSFDRLRLPELEEVEPISARLLLRFPQSGRWRKLVIRPPDRLEFDRRTNDRVVCRFLEERGFVVGPAANEAPTPPRIDRRGQLGLWGA